MQFLHSFTLHDMHLSIGALCVVVQCFYLHHNMYMYTISFHNRNSYKKDLCFCFAYYMTPIFILSYYGMGLSLQDICRYMGFNVTKFVVVYYTPYRRPYCDCVIQNSNNSAVPLLWRVFQNASVNLDSLSCSFTFISFLTKWHNLKVHVYIANEDCYPTCFQMRPNVQKMVCMILLYGTFICIVSMICMCFYH